MVQERAGYRGNFGGVQRSPYRPNIAPNYRDWAGGPYAGFDAASAGAATFDAIFDHARASGATYFDATKTMRFAEENRFPNGGDITGAIPARCSLTNTADTPPVTGATVCQLERTVGASSAVAGSAVEMVVGQSYRVKFRAKGVDATQPSVMAFDGTNNKLGTRYDVFTGAVLAAGSAEFTEETFTEVAGHPGWWEYSGIFTPTLACSLWYISVHTGSSVGDKTLFAGVSLQTGVVDYGFFPTTGSAYYGPRRKCYDPSDGSFLGALNEPVAATNLCLHNRDATNAAWVATNVTAAKDQTGIDGDANSASSITATAGNATILQSITDASAERVSSAWVKRITGTGTVEMTQDGGSTWTAITVTGGWTRVEIAAATVLNPVVGFRIVTSGDAIAFDVFQQEVGAYPSSEIETAATSVTRNAETLKTSPGVWRNGKPATILTVWKPRQFVAGQQSWSCGIPQAYQLYSGSTPRYLVSRVALTWSSNLDLGVPIDGDVDASILCLNSNGSNYFAAQRSGNPEDNTTISVTPDLDIDEINLLGGVSGYLQQLKLWDRALV